MSAWIDGGTRRCVRLVLKYLRIDRVASSRRRRLYVPIRRPIDSPRHHHDRDETMGHLHLGRSDSGHGARPSSLETKAQELMWRAREAESERLPRRASSRGRHIEASVHADLDRGPRSSDPASESLERVTAFVTCGVDYVSIGVGMAGGGEGCGKDEEEEWVVLSARVDGVRGRGSVSRVSRCCGALNAGRGLDDA